MDEGKRTPRQIRLNDSEWAAFRSLLGVRWLRSQIEKKIKNQGKKKESENDSNPQ